MKRSALALPLALYSAGLALLGNWIIDDAGISFAYARNLGRGFGFVSQPGRAPVEGFSNLSWVMLLAPLARFSWFDPIVAAKLLGVALILASLLVARRGLAGERPAIVLAASLLIAGAPPIIIWTSSGLENGLMLLLALSLWAIVSERRRGWALASGVIAGLMAATHPEGLLYVAVAPLVIAFDREASRLRAIAQSLGGWALVVAPLLALRRALFHLWMPHTWYAKRVDPSLSARLQRLLLDPLATLSRLDDLCRGALGPAGAFLLAGALAVLIARRRTLPRWLGVAFTLQLVSFAAYLAIDDDWMGEYRFGTVPIAASALVLTGAVAVVGREFTPRLTGLAALALAAALTLLGVPRLWRFAANPPTPFAEVDRLWRQKLDAFAGALRVRDPSMYLADVGAPLWYSPLRVIDAAGLCEPEVVATLKDHGAAVTWQLNSPAFYRWLFEVAKPTFVATHDFWTVVAQLDRSPRFAADYVAVDSYLDQYARDAYHVVSRSGIWVRRDALSSPDVLDRLRAWRSAPRSEPPAWRLWDALHPSNDRAALIQRGLELARHDPNRAATLFARARMPGDLRLQRATAETLDAASRVDEARDLWQPLAAQQTDRPTQATARDRLGLPDLDDGLAARMDAAIDALYTRRDPATAVTLLRSILAQAPDHYGATFQLARALHDAGRRDESAAQYQRALEMAKKIGDERTIELVQEDLKKL